LFLIRSVCLDDYRPPPVANAAPQVPATGNVRRIDAEASSTPLALHPDRYFDPDPSIRRVARELFEETRHLPLICPHGHVDPRLLAENRPFPEPTALLITPDHYILRMMYSRGVPLESLGIPSRDGTATARDPREVWTTFAAHYYLFRGTPTGAWLDHELHDLFGVRVKLTADTALHVYDEIAEKLESPEFLPRALFDRFNIEVLATTDAATDPLDHHQAIRDSDWDGTVVPCFRPDALFRIASPKWADAIDRLGAVHGAPIATFAAFLDALADRRRFFASMGATSTDHAVVEPYTEQLPAAETEALFARALARMATAADQRRFEAHMLMEMARMSTEDGLVMQIHPGSLRDHHDAVAARFGPDMGADIPIVTEYTRNLRALLNAYGADPRLTLILYTLVIYVRNMLVGLESVPTDVLEAADASGFRSRERLLRVELPLATPLIVSGLRLACVSTIGLVTITSTIGDAFGGLGFFIKERPFFATEVLVGALGSIALALAADAGFARLQRRLTPWARAQSGPAEPK